MGCASYSFGDTDFPRIEARPAIVLRRPVLLPWAGNERSLFRCKQIVHMPSHSTPSGVVREYFETLRWIAKQAQSIESETHARRFAAISTIQAVAAVEVFLNLWFRASIAGSGDQGQLESFLRDLKANASLERRLSTWPKKFLGQKLDLRKGPGLAFVELKRRRNAIIHFESGYETVHFPRMIVHGLADTSEYDSLSGQDAATALAIAEDFTAEIFRLAGFDSLVTETALSAWIGKSSNNPLVDKSNQSLQPWLAPYLRR